MSGRLPQAYFSGQTEQIKQPLLPLPGKVLVQNVCCCLRSQQIRVTCHSSQTTVTRQGHRGNAGVQTNIGQNSPRLGARLATDAQLGPSNQDSRSARIHGAPTRVPRRQSSAPNLLPNRAEREYSVALACLVLGQMVG